MRRGIVIRLGLCAIGLALAGCSDPSTSDKAADPAQATVTVTAPASDPQAKDTARAGEPSKRTATDKQAAADVSKRSVTKSAPATKLGAGKNGAPPGKVGATNASPPEVTLAVIDEKSAYVKKTTVRRYAGLLDRLERACEERREQLAESALSASHATQQLSILDVLREVVASHPSGECIDAFTRVAQ